jgi:hypothetical protein
MWVKQYEYEMTFTDKIVTLSYGTLSCSLQGFDDKFDILKPIADYFRDLWIDAHQNGKGLPAPDADDLARIVGEVIAHPVEGYEAQGVIILNPAASGAVADTAGEDVENMDETSDQEEAVADPAEGDEAPLDEMGGSRPLSEETVAAISDILTSQEEAMLKAPETEVELAEDGNIFEKEVASGEASLGEDMADDPEQSDTEQNDTDTGDAAGDAGNIFDDDQAAAADGSDSDVKEDVEEDVEEGESAEEAPKPIVRPSRIGRVIKMRRGDFDAAIRDGVIEEEPDSPDGAAMQRGKEAQGQRLSDESEADLQRQLAEAEGAPMAGKDVVMPSKPKASGRRKGVDRLQSSERRSDLERIFEEADSQLGKSDTSERRSAIHHLRAAVAATRAEKSAGHELNRHTDETPYRTDLAEAVDEVGGVTKKSRSKRKNTSVLPPLKLIADQRIDSDKT